MEAIYTDDDAAREHLEGLLWPDGPVCPRCGVLNEATKLKGKSTRPGVWNCRPCDKPFTVTVGTIYERSHIPLSKWVYATHLMASSKKGISASQLHRMLDFGSYRTAWFMAHRIREAMKGSADGPLGGEGKIVEADEAYHGKVDEPRKTRVDGQPYKKGSRGPANKRAVVALVERGGKAVAFHVGQADKETVAKIVVENVHPASRLHTDESRLYTGADQHAATHETVKHAANEYARGDVTTNSVEGFFSVFKRGMTGVYQTCGEKYLQRYVTEFEFRHNTRAKLGFDDGDRATLATKGAAGKRLTLRMPKGQQATA
jgi:transposase-like protein